MTSTIDPELARSFEDASAALIDRIREAIRDFRAAPPDHQAAWELRSTPGDWETRVLSNLEKYHRNLQAALRVYDAGDITRITQEAGAYKDLSKDLDGYDMDWMTEQDRLAVDEAITRAVMVAARINHLGYDELEGRGNSDPGVMGRPAKSDRAVACRLRRSIPSWHDRLKTQALRSSRVFARRSVTFTPRHRTAGRLGNCGVRRSRGRSERARFAQSGRRLHRLEAQGCFPCADC